MNLTRSIRTRFILVCCLAVSACVTEGDVSVRPSDFVLIPPDSPIRTEVRYFTADNFVGEPITGYLAPCIYLTDRTYQALLDVAEELDTFGIGVKFGGNEQKVCHKLRDSTPFEFSS